MELFKSLQNRTKTFNSPFNHFELDKPLTDEAIKEICSAEIPDPKKKKFKLRWYKSFRWRRWCF